MNELRDFMFERVYHVPEQQRQQQQAIAIIRDLMDWHLEHPDEIPAIVPPATRRHRPCSRPPTTSPA